MCEEIKLLYKHLSLAFEEQIGAFFVRVIKEAFIKAGYNLKDIVITHKLNLKWEKNKENKHKKGIFSGIKDMIKNAISNVKASFNVNTKEYKYYEELEGLMKKFEAIEFDFLLFAFDKEDPKKKMTIVIDAERPIILTTPFCIPAEVTIRGVQNTLKFKLKQITRLLFFLKDCFPFIEHNFVKGDSIKDLINEDALNIYPFIIVDGIKTTQHKNFNELTIYQQSHLLCTFSFYKMIKGVVASSIPNNNDEISKKRINEGFLIDLLHFENQFAPEKLFHKMETMEKNLKRGFNNLKRHTRRSTRQLNKKLDATNLKLRNIEITGKQLVDKFDTEISGLKTDVKELKESQGSMKEMLVSMKKTQESMQRQIYAMFIFISIMFSWVIWNILELKSLTSKTSS